MKRSKVMALFVVLGLVLVCGVIYRYKIYLSAWMWHYQHGSSLIVGDYVVPVPNNWYVDNVSPDVHLLVRLDTDDRTPTKKFKGHTSMSFAEAPLLANDKDLDLKTTLDIDLLKKKGVDPVLRQTFNLSDGKTIVCTGGYKPGSNGNLDMEPAAWFCSSLGLEITILATEPDMKQAWHIVSAIHKTS